MQASASSQATPIEADAAEIAHATAEGQQQRQHVTSDDAAQHQDGHTAVFGAEELSGERHGSHAEAGPSEQQQQRPASFVITHSVAKRHNVGTIARCATAFGVKQLCLVGSRHFNTFGSHGSDAFVDFGHYHTLEQCIQHLKNQEGCNIVGVEIVEGAQPIHAHPFSGPTAFMLGNEGQGLSPRQMALCDSFVYIPQYGAGTASLNVAVACSIVLHHFALWAGYQERDRSGFKFVVGPRQPRTRPRNIAGDPEEVRRQREARRQQGQEEGSDGEGVGLDWLDNVDGERGGEGSEEGEQEEQLEAQKA